MVASKIKVSDRQEVCRQIMALLKKKYKEKIPNHDRSVLDALMFGVCLENATYEDAEKAFDHLQNGFHDLNEIRVSSITEIQNKFAHQSDPEWRAMRVREILQFVFEKFYEFEFDGLKKKTLEQAEKQLGKIRSLSPFVRNFTLNTALGAHVVPVDDHICRTAKWLGLVESQKDLNAASETLKSSVRKAETAEFCHLIRLVATDPNYMSYWEEESSTQENGEPRLFSAVSRLEAVLSGKHAAKAQKKSEAKKGASTSSAKSESPSNKKSPAKKATKAKGKKKTVAKGSSSNASKSSATRATKKKAKKTGPKKKKSK